MTTPLRDVATIAAPCQDSSTDSSAVAELRDVTWTYGAKLRGFQVGPLSISLSAGAFWGVVGPNGAGKTTTLQLISGVLTPRAGSAWLGGQPISSMTRKTIARNVAYVPHERALELPFRVRDLVALGRTPHLGRLSALRPEDLCAVEHALRDTELTPHAERDARELSAGEQQRVWIARGLAQQTPLLVLDEPVSHLDWTHAWRIMTLLRDLTRQGHAVVAAVHDLELAARFCSHLMVMRNGQVVAAASPEAVLTPSLIGHVFGMHAHVAFSPETGHICVQRVGPV
jgi:iron complex transport system ATP-binding protein